jgi:hypothetical protein
MDQDSSRNGRPGSAVFNYETVPFMKRKNRTETCDLFVARGLGIEPRCAASKAAVLPLDDPRTFPASEHNVRVRADYFNGRTLHTPLPAKTASRSILSSHYNMKNEIGRKNLSFIQDAVQLKPEKEPGISAETGTRLPEITFHNLPTKKPREPKGRSPVRPDA